jgi:cytidylate kinase
MVIGVTGPLGAGKDTAAEYIAGRIQGIHVSGGDVLRDMLATLGLEPKKSALGDFGTFLRTHYGKDSITNMIEKKAESATHLVASGFRSVVEAQEWQRRGGIVLYINASNSLRHDRIGARARMHDICRSIRVLPKWPRISRG